MTENLGSKHSSSGVVKSNQAGLSLGSSGLIPNNFGPYSLEELGESLIQFNAQIIKIPNPQAAEGAKSLMITVSQPGPLVALVPLIEELSSHPDCAEIAIFGADVGMQDFYKHPQLSKLEYSMVADITTLSTEDFFSSLLAHTAISAPSVVITTNESILGPQLIMQCLAKKSLGAAFLVLVAESPDCSLGLPYELGLLNTYPEIAPIDLFLCNDELTESVVKFLVGDRSTAQVLVTGTGQLDSIYQTDTARLRQSALEKLSLSGTEKCFLFLGDIAESYPIESRIDLDLNNKSFEALLQATSSLALMNPSTEYRLLLRPHPRDARKDEISQYSKCVLPSNIKITEAPSSRCTIDEASAITLAVLSTTRTEVFKAPLRGLEGIFLGLTQSDELEGYGLGSQCLRLMAPPIQHVFSAPPKGLSLAKNSADILTILDRVSKHSAKMAIPSNNPPTQSGKIMANAIFKIMSQ